MYFLTGGKQRVGNFIDSENNLASLKYVVNILSLEVTFPKKRLLGHFDQ